ncbi:alpha/beta fold hydrolase [Actinopolymorpha alba]|uniref:alpha/beta fold hydrolase n=1 Tax=Actinopolymorpha alba TaxID=533267 RepID=UPI00036585BA|nr:alpha/beta hydrolase [Actinopolymorpha alba]
MKIAVSLVGSALNAASLLSPRTAGKAALALWRRPMPRGTVRTVERETHDAAVTERISINGKDVVAYRWGDGEKPVLMVHGWQSRGSRYAGFVPVLRGLGFSPVTFDAPGHGDSGGTSMTILEYEEVIRHLQGRYGLFDAVIAHSFGVPCVLHALRNGVGAGRLVAVSGVADFEFLVDEFTRQLGLSARMNQELRRRIEEDLFPHETEIWERFSSVYQPTSLDIPMLAIHDEDDDWVPLEHAHRITAAHGARLLVTRNLGHRGMLGQPEVIDAAVEFITADIASLAHPDVKNGNAQTVG